MKTAEVIFHCFSLSILFLGIVAMIAAHIALIDNPVARAEHPTLYFSLTATTVFNIGVFAFHFINVWRSIDTSLMGKGDSTQ